MRTRTARLTGAIAGLALIATPLAVAGPTHAAEPGFGTLNVTIADDQGRPVNGLVMLIPAPVEGQEGPSDPIFLGDDEEFESAPSSYSEEVPAGKYGIITIGGWSLMTCAGLEDCMAFMAEQAPKVTPAGAFTVTDQGVVDYKVTTPSPKLSGTGKVGSPLVVDAPEFLDGEGDALLAQLGELALLYGNSMKPVIIWKRNNVTIRSATDSEYVPTGADAGATITAEVRVPTFFRMFTGTGSGGPFSAPGVVPENAKLGPITVTKQDSTTDVQVVGKRRVGKVPSAWFTVEAGGNPATGWLTVTGAADKPLRLRLRDGFAKVDLKRLRAGKHKITATFAGSSAVNASTDSISFKMKKAKKNKKR